VRGKTRDVSGCGIGSSARGENDLVDVHHLVREDECDIGALDFDERNHREGPYQASPEHTRVHRHGGARIRAERRDAVTSRDDDSKGIGRD
jgi:hypothetical protein